MINFLNMYSLGQQWSARNGVRSHSFVVFWNIRDINGHYASITTMHRVQTKSTCPGNHSLSQINYENVLQTFITETPNGNEKADAACERDNGKWYHVQFLCSFSCIIMLCRIGPTGRRPFKVKQKAETSTAECSSIACRALVPPELCAFFFSPYSHYVCSLLVLLLIYVVLVVLCTCATCVKRTQRSAGNTPEKFFSLTRAFEKESFVRCCFFFSPFSVSFAVNAIVDRNRVVQWRRNRRKEKVNAPSSVWRRNVFNATFSCRFLYARFLVASWDWRRKETRIAPEIIYDNRMFLMAAAL